MKRALGSFVMVLGGGILAVALVLFLNRSNMKINDTPVAEYPLLLLGVAVVGASMLVGGARWRRRTSPPLLEDHDARVR